MPDDGHIDYLPEFDEITELDFSEFHDLMHPIWDLHCGDMPGGRSRHFSLAWHYKWKPWLRRNTACRIGWHSWVDFWSSAGRDDDGKRLHVYGGKLCPDCHKEKGK